MKRSEPDVRDEERRDARQKSISGGWILRDLLFLVGREEWDPDFFIWLDPPIYTRLYKRWRINHEEIYDLEMKDELNSRPWDRGSRIILHLLFILSYHHHPPICRLLLADDGCREDEESCPAISFNCSSLYEVVLKDWWTAAVIKEKAGTDGKEDKFLIPHFFHLDFFGIRNLLSFPILYPFIPLMFDQKDGRFDTEISLAFSNRP